MRHGSRLIKIAGYTFIGKNADNGHGGVGILIKDY